MPRYLSQHQGVYNWNRDRSHTGFMRGIGVPGVPEPPITSCSCLKECVKTCGFLEPDGSIGGARFAESSA